MPGRHFVLLGLLCLVGFLAGRAGRQRAIPVVSTDSLRRIAAGADSEQDRRALASAAAAACGLRMPEGAMDDPHLLRVDLAPGGGLEVALAARVGTGDGFLVVLAVAADGWRVLNHLGPAVLGEPTSLSVLDLPGRTAALVLTDLADQMAGAFCQRETCSILALREGALARIWGREIEIRAYWNREWSDPPGHGWLRLSGEAQYEFCCVGAAPAITVTYRNTLAEAPQSGRLPEEGSFVVRLGRTGEEVYHWDPALGLFILGYGRTRVRTPLQRRDGGSVMKPVADLAPGESVAILGDERNEPRALLDDSVYLRVYAAGRTGLVEPGAIEMAGSLQKS